MKGNVKAAKRVRYYWVPQRQVIVCTTQRAASASMAESLAPNHGRSEVIGKNRVLGLKGEGAKVLLWIRDPLDRLACAYPIFGKNTLSTAVISPNEYAEKILAQGNVHWSPQYLLHRVARHGFLPTHVYPFESLAESWPMEIGYKHPLQHVGAQTGRLTWDELADAMDPDLIHRIDMHWATDLALHDMVLDHWKENRTAFVMTNEDLFVLVALSALNREEQAA